MKKTTIFVLIEDEGITVFSKGGLLKYAKEKYNIRTSMATVAMRSIKFHNENITLYESELQ